MVLDAPALPLPHRGDFGCPGPGSLPQVLARRCSADQITTLQFPILGGRTLKPALRVALPTTGHKGDQRVRVRGRIQTLRRLDLGEAQALLERRFEPVVELVDSSLQTLVFVD